MSQHPSLRSGDKHKKHRSVLKRYERIKSLKEKEKWREGESIFGLPKLKIVRFRIKKEKAPEAEAAAAEAAGAGAQAAPSAKPEQGKAKEAAPKKEERKAAKGGDK